MISKYKERITISVDKLRLKKLKMLAKKDKSRISTLMDDALRNYLTIYWPILNKDDEIDEETIRIAKTPWLDN